MRALLTFLVALTIAPLIHGATTIGPQQWNRYAGTRIIAGPFDSLETCADAPEGKYTCRTSVRVTVAADPVPVCTSPKPDDLLRAQACPSGTTGTWKQTSSYVSAPPPLCWAPSNVWAPSSPSAEECAPIQPPPPPTAGVLFSEDFRTGDLSHTENGVRWLGRGTNSSVVSDSASPSGKALRLRYPAAPDGGDGWAEQRLVLPNLTDVYIQVTARIADNYCQRDQSTGGKNNKAERFWHGNLSDGNDGYTRYYIKGGHSTVPAGDCGSSLITEWGRTGGGDEKVGRNSTASASGWITAEDRGRVVKFTFHARTDTQGPAGAKNAATGGNGALEAWKDDRQVASFTNLIWRSADGKNELFSHAYLWGWANTGFAEETIFHVYGVTISTTKPAGLQ